MLKVVLDTNIVFSALLTRNSDFRDLLFDATCTFYAPSFLFVELFKHKERLLTISKATEQDVLTYLNEIFACIQFIPDSLISTKVLLASLLVL